MRVRKGSKLANRSPNQGSSACASDMMAHPSLSLCGLSRCTTGARTAEISAWKRGSDVGRNEKIVRSAPAASRASSSVTMKVSEKRG